MPGVQNLVHIGPAQLLAPQHGPVVGLENDVAVKAHLAPGGQVLLLPRGGLPVLQAQQGHELGNRLPCLLVLLDMGGGAFLVKDPMAGPGVALLLDLAQGGPPPRAVPGGDFLHAEAHQGENHIRRQAQMVIEAQEDLQIRGGELLAQLVLHRAGEAGELVPLQGPGHIGPGVLGAAVLPPGGRWRLLRRRRGAPAGRRHNKTQARQGGQTPAEPLLRPSQLAEQLVVVNAAVTVQHRDIEQGCVAVPAADETPGRRAGEDNTLILRQVKYIAADDHRLLSFSSEGILHDIDGFVKRQSCFWGQCRSRRAAPGPGAARRNGALPAETS